MFTKRAHSVRIPDASWNEMKRIAGDHDPKPLAEPQDSNPYLAQFQNPEHEFSNLVGAIRQCRDNLQKIVYLAEPWRQERNLVVASDQEMIKIELLRLLRLVCDRTGADDDALASFVLFFIEADWDNDLSTLRRELEEASFYGSSSLFEDEESIFSIDGDSQMLLSPSDFYRFYCFMPDLALLVNEMESQINDVYLGVVAQFCLEASKSALLVGGRAKSFGRTATFCSTHFQFAEHMKSSRYESPKSLMETFEFSVANLDIAEDLKRAVGCMAFLEDDYLSVLGNVFESLAALDRARDLSDDVDDDGYNSVETESDSGGGDYRNNPRERLVALRELYDDGLISEEELEIQRSRILGEI